MKQLGRYELRDVLGEGGMGTVYDAVLTGPAGFRKPVALKVLKAHGDGLAREARLGGLLQHRNLVEVYALEEIDGVWVCAMERLPGGTLRRDAPLPPAAVVQVGIQVCAGLQHAHERIGLVHGDLKPSNLLLSGATVKIGDFGIARARGFGGARGVQGTPAYMSPEQARGDRMDGRSDLYSLGVCLYELATGMRPALRTGPGTTASTIDLDTLDDLEAPAPEVGELPWLAPILAKCLAADPEDRYPDAAALADALGALDVPGKGLADALGLTGTPVSPRRSTRSSRSISRTRPGAGQTNLGAEVDAFVGRLRDLDALDRALEDGHVVTLKGMGGAGKTRLARQFADRWIRRTAGQAWFVDLAAARTGQDLLRAVAGVLSVPLGAGSTSDLAGQLGRALAGRGAVLLVLDNFEQIAELGALVQGWAGGGVRLLITSREPIRIQGEAVYELSPLELDEAVELLTRRAADRGRDVAGDPALQELARRLDGLPLALELAAGRLSVLTPAQILTRLDARMKLLGGGVRGGRQATLRATLDTSWDLLDEHERSALAQLSVFRGGFDLEMVERVIDLPPDAPWGLDLVGALVDRSLVVRRFPGSRFDLLETVRVYAADKLGDPTEMEIRHGRAYAELAVELIDWRRPQLDRWSRLVNEIDNLVVACERAIERGDAQVAVDTLKTASELLDIRGPHLATLDLAARVEALPLDRRQQALHDVLTSRTLRRCGRTRDAIARASRAREVFAELGEARHEGDALSHLGNLNRMVGQADKALELLEAAEARYREIGDERSVAVAWGNRGSVLYNTGELDQARSLYEAALHVRRSLGDRRGEAHLLSSLAVVEQVLGQRGAARRRYEEALLSCQDVGDRRGEALALANLGVLAVDDDDVAEAEGLWRKALEIRRSMGEQIGVGVLYGYLSLLAIERGRYDQAETHARAALELHRQIGVKRLQATMLGQLGAIEVCRGDAGAARELLVQARDLSASVGDRIGLATSLHWWARMRKLEGRAADALEALDAAAEAVGGRHLPTECLIATWRAWALDALGRQDEAREAIETALIRLRSGSVNRGVPQALILEAWILRDPERLAAAESRVPHAEGPTRQLYDEVRALLG